MEGDRVYLVRGLDEGRRAWYYVLVRDDDDVVAAFKEGLKAETINLEDYGKILESGYGKDPPNEVKDQMEKNYYSKYT